MSHVAQCSVVIKSLEDLELAVKRLGGTLVRGQKKIRWYGNFVDDSTTWKTFFSKEEAARISKLPSSERKAIINEEMSRSHHAIKFHGVDYEIGIVQEEDGTFRARWDSWGGGLNRFIGSDGGLLSQAYAVEAAKRAARRKGFAVREEKSNNGSIKLRLLVQ